MKKGFTLAEVSMTKRMSGNKYHYLISRVSESKEQTNKIKKLLAFTLAEVLITLAIIGVVAALTISSVVANYQKKMYATQLKKEYNNITKSFKTIMAQDGVTRLDSTGIWTSIPNMTAHPSDLSSLPNFASELSRIFNIIKVYDSVQDLIEETGVNYKYLNGENVDIPISGGIVLADGAIITFEFSKNPVPPDDCDENSCKTLKDYQKFKNTSTKLWEHMGWILIDVNGAKTPNLFGRDVFIYHIGNDGMLYPQGGSDFAVYADSCDCNDTETCSLCWNYNGSDTGSCKIGTKGMGCAARIMEENWEMKY